MRYLGRTSKNAKNLYTERNYWLLGDVEADDWMMI